MVEVVVGVVFAGGVLGFIGYKLYQKRKTLAEKAKSLKDNVSDRF